MAGSSTSDLPTMTSEEGKALQAQLTAMRREAKSAHRLLQAAISTMKQSDGSLSTANKVARGKNNKQVKQVDQNQDLQIVRLMRKKEMIFLMLTLRR